MPRQRSGQDEYSEPITVYLEIGTHNRQPLFGELAHGGVLLTKGGKAAKQHIESLDTYVDGVIVDTSLVMPDAVHAIVMLGTDPFARSFPDLSRVVAAFRKRVLDDWKEGVARRGWANYEGHLWQKSYRDTLIESATQLNDVRARIYSLPSRAQAAAGNDPEVN